MLPPSLNAAEETRKLAIAYVCEAHNALASEAITIERRYRQCLVAARSLELRMLTARGKVGQLKQRVDMLVGIALDEIAATTGSADNKSDVTANASTEPLDYIGTSHLSNCLN